MQLPQETELWYVIPTIRKALVVELKKQDIKQKDIAPLLGITESAVSQYVKDKRAAFCYEFFDKPPMKPEIKLSAMRILSQKRPEIVIQEINRLCRIAKEKRIICAIRKKKDPSLKSCNVCYEGEES